MKKLIALCLVLALLLVVRPLSAAYTTGGAKLSTLSDEAILAFLEEYDVEIPEGFAETDAELAATVRAWIAQVENSPNTEFNYNHSVLYDFSNSIKVAVNDYYGITPNTGLISTFAAYQLQQSTLWWRPDNYQNFNCYAYALGRSDRTYNPGDFSEEISYSEFKNMSTEDLAGCVENDLRGDEYGYGCVTITLTRPDYEDLAATKTAICIRKGKYNSNDPDYHLARLFYETEDEYGDAWRHKPGSSYILQYIYYPSSSVDWIGEGYGPSGATLNTNGLTYTGEIYYIIFAENCAFGAPVLTHDYHQGTTNYYQYTKTCTQCGATASYTRSEYCNGLGCGGSGLIPNNQDQEGVQ